MKKIPWQVFVLGIGLILVFSDASGQAFFNNLLDILFGRTKVATSTNQNNSNNYFISLPSAISLENVVTGIVERTSPAVVSIVISKYVPVIERFYFNPFEDLDLPPELKPFFQFEFPAPRSVPNQNRSEKRKVGGGTGFIVSPDGLIVTNKHVVSDREAEYTVYLSNGKKYTAKVLAVHPVDDLALIKINANNLPVLKLGDSDRIKLGQFVLAIGNALAEFQNTVSFGVVSGLKRSITASDESGNIERLDDLIQTDAAINFGNSGGPLINLQGEVIGVNTAIAGGAENIGFAIPVNRAKKMIEEFNRKGKIEVPFLGVYYMLVNDEIQKKFDLPVNYGAFIYRDKESAIVPNSPAEKAGLRNRDIILEIDNEKITPQNNLAQIVSRKNIGQRISLKVLRENREITLYAVIGSLPENSR
ncbi:MAG: trypsin-like peptidase domain-containing protein [Patescibacteria group bacterium]|nr:trypsin-like peptidase domain-containing protein [Patescibacteria group bacterium]